MNVVLLKDWGDHKKGSQVTINDESVLKEGFRVGLFQNPEDTPTPTPVEDKTENPDVILNENSEEKTGVVNETENPDVILNENSEEKTGVVNETENPDVKTEGKTKKK